MRILTETDAVMFNIMESMKRLSRCIDKQVVCLIVNSRGEIESVGVNTIILCDKNCHDKENRTCVVDHAEIVALRNWVRKEAHESDMTYTAYTSLFPCAPCQNALAPYVDEIVSFGMVHKDWVTDKLVVFGHPIYKNITYDTTPEEECRPEEIDEQEYFLNRNRIIAQIRKSNFYENLNVIAHCSLGARLFSTNKQGLIAYTKTKYDASKA